MAKTRALTEAKESFTNNKKEGFSNACKSKCANVNTEADIASMTSNSECYKCEVKYNPYIRYSAPREKLIREARYKANNQDQLNPKLYRLRGQQESQKSKLDAKTTTYVEVKTGKPGTIGIPLTETECKQYSEKLGYGFFSNSTHDPKGCTINMNNPNSSKGFYNTNINSDTLCSGSNKCIEKSLSDNSQTALVNRNRNLFDELKNMPPSKKRNATINAYLEDM